MARLYCPKESITGKEIVINKLEQIHYISHVLRLKANDEIFVFDGEANEYHCWIQESSRKAIKLLIKEKRNHQVLKKITLTVACAVPKQKSRFEDLVDKLSQLGVDKIIPMTTERVVVRWDARKKQQYLERWLKIAQQACAQAGRNILPVIEPIQDINQVLTRSETYDLKLIPTLLIKKQGLRDIYAEGFLGKIIALIGPEGDFTSREISQAEDKGFIPVSLGDLVLRVDTAAIAVCAFFRLTQH